MKKVYLVRHAQSKANVNHRELQKTSNPSIHLTPTGFEQVKETAEFLKNHVSGEIVVWNSPYKRTRQTAQVIKDVLAPVNHLHAKESIYLSERQFGLVDDVANYHEQYQHEANHYRLHVDTKTEFFVRPPLGESPFDMCIRLDTFMKQEIERSKQDTHIIVSHGAAIRGIMMMALHWEFEKFGMEPNPNNASVLLMTFDEKESEWNLKGFVFKPSVATT